MASVSHHLPSWLRPENDTGMDSWKWESLAINYSRSDSAPDFNVNKLELAALSSSIAYQMYQRVGIDPFLTPGYKPEDRYFPAGFVADVLGNV
jgi:hypothetical protein